MKRSKNRVVAVLLVAALAVGSVACESTGSKPAPLAGTTVSDERVKLDDAWLFIPAGISHAADEVELTLHLHGARELVEARFMDAKQPGILLNVTLPGLSSVYRKKFGDPQVFPRILEEARVELNARGINVRRFEKVTVTSFSAGFGGVREILKDPRSFDRIDTLIMADSIYAGYVGDREEHNVNPAHMEDFARFAAAAAEGRKRLLITHTDLIPEGYASTAETADFLIAELGGERALSDETFADGLRLKSRYFARGCEILGFTGVDGEAHMKHLRRIDLWLKRAR
ncbi:MAG: hypothetical protein ACI9VS_002276 [Candidatus Binatia bacterium]|jgi:hypothetical protein